MKNQISYSPEVRERAVRLVFEQQKEHESQWSSIKSIASKIGCTAETLRAWVRRAETDRGIRGGLSTSDRERLKELERENRELAIPCRHHKPADWPARFVVSAASDRHRE